MKRFATCCLCCWLAAQFCPRVAGQTAPIDVDSTSLRDLMNIEVTSVAKKNEKVSQTAAAVFVITQEEIRRSGASSIPELLRMVPGLDVARVDGNVWAISARGFNGRFANELLVLIDGRSVYSPLLSGVNWDAQDVVLEDIDRIEVIRGPGAAVWGANAMNGVINIITKKASDTHGGMVTASTGTEDRAEITAVYGGRIGKSVYYRISAKYFDRAPASGFNGFHDFDGTYQGRLAIRVDGTARNGDAYSLQAAAYDGKSGIESVVPIYTRPYTNTFAEKLGVAGGDVLGSWTHLFHNGSDATLQIYYDRFSRQQFMLGQDLGTFDVDFKHHIPIWPRNDFMWGVGVRLIQAGLRETSIAQFTKDDASYYLGSAFLQDEISLFPDRLRLTLGSKFEYSSESGANIQPSARLLYTPAAAHTLWAAVSRAVRTPSIGELSMNLLISTFAGPGGRPGAVILQGNPNLKGEDVLAYESGYRTQVTKRLSFDVAAFYDQYRHMELSYPGSISFDPETVRYVLPVFYRTGMDARTRGLEVSATWKLNRTWDLTGAVTLLHMALFPYNGAAYIATLAPNAGDSPTHQFQLHSHKSLPHRLEFDASAFRVSELPRQGVPAYTRVDARFGWMAGENVNVSLNAENLLTPSHLEFGKPQLMLPAYIDRNVSLKIVWRF